MTNEPNNDLLEGVFINIGLFPSFSRVSTK